MGLNKRLLVSGEEGGIVAAGNFTPFSYDGNAGTNEVTGVGFQPDLVWIKNRATASHGLVDSVRGNNSVIFSDLTADESALTGGDISMDTDGFDINTYSSAWANGSSNSYISWCFKAGGNSNTFNVDGTGYSTASAAGLTSGGITPSGASVNTAAGFSIIKYTGTNSSSSIAHGLNSAPELYFIKPLSRTGSWGAYTTATGDLEFSYLNSNNLSFTTSVMSDPTASVINVNHTEGMGTNYLTGTYICYAFHSVDGYQKIGSYAGNSYSDVTVTTGFRPRFVMIKSIPSGGGWTLYDEERQDFDSFEARALQANTNSDEWGSSYDSYYGIKATSTGFIVQHFDGGNDTTSASGKTYLYLAIA